MGGIRLVAAGCGGEAAVKEKSERLAEIASRGREKNPARRGGRGGRGGGHRSRGAEMFHLRGNAGYSGLCVCEEAAASPVRKSPARARVCARALSRSRDPRGDREAHRFCTRRGYLRIAA